GQTGISGDSFQGKVIDPPASQEIRADFFRNEPALSPSRVRFPSDKSRGAAAESPVKSQRGEQVQQIVFVVNRQSVGFYPLSALMNLFTSSGRFPRISVW